MGVSLQSQLTVALELELGLLAAVRPRDAALPERHWYLLRPANTRARPPVEQFVEFVRGAAGQQVFRRAQLGGAQNRFRPGNPVALHARRHGCARQIPLEARPWMTAVRALDRVHGQRADGVDAEPVEPCFSDRQGAGSGCRLGAHVFTGAEAPVAEGLFSRRVPSPASAIAALAVATW